MAVERYVSGRVTIDKSGDREGDLTETENLQYKTDTVFLQVLAEAIKVFII